MASLARHFPRAVNLAYSDGIFGSWLSDPEDLVPEAMGSCNESGRGFALYNNMERRKIDLDVS
jgi:hypothetical protein